MVIGPVVFIAQDPGRAKMKIDSKMCFSLLVLRKFICRYMQFLPFFSLLHFLYFLTILLGWFQHFMTTFQLFMFRDIKI